MQAGVGGDRVVVVGAGIAGASAAYHLAGAGARVTVVSLGDVEGQASGNNPGGLNPLYGAGIPGPLSPLALEAFHVHLATWDDVARRSGIDFGGARKRRLNLAVDERDVAALEAMRTVYEATPDFSARWLEADELRELEPRLAGSVVRGLLNEGDARVDPARYTRAVLRAAQELGAEVVLAEATGLAGPPGGVQAVELLDHDAIPCRAVVLATGAWCDAPSRWLGVPLPVVPVKGDLLLVELPGGGTAVDLAWRDAAVYRTSGAGVWLGGSEEHAGFDVRPSANAARSIRERVGRVLPEAASAPLLRQTTGLRPVSADGLPIVGPIPGRHDVVVALAGGRKGMLFGAAMGRAVADLLTTGRTELTIDACSPGRFAVEGAR